MLYNLIHDFPMICMFLMKFMSCNKMSFHDLCSSCYCAFSLSYLFDLMRCVDEHDLICF